MEPADLNSPANANDDARLEALLRRDLPALPDRGFSARVLAALPETEQPRRVWRRLVSCLIGAAAGAGFALWQGVSQPHFQSGAKQLSAALTAAGQALADPRIGAALVVALLSLLVASWNELRERLLA